MSRKVKNIITIVLLLVLFSSVYFTMNYIKNNAGEMNKTPPSMNDNEQSQNSNMEQPLEKPEGENNESSSESSEMPSGNNNSNNGTPPDIPSNSNGENSMSNNTSQSLEMIYYVLFGVESLIIAILIMYLIMSRFNKKTIKQTFSNKDKAIIGVLIVIILTSGLTYLCGKITIDYFLNSPNSKNNLSSNDEQTSSITYSAVKEITDDTAIESGEFKSSTSDENVILVSGEIDATLSNIKVNKTGDSDGGDNTSFYGNNSAILAKDGANLILKNITVTTNATGANGVFSYGGSATTNNSTSDGTSITISGSKITTTKDNSGGIMTTGGGIMKASNLTVNTAGTSSAAIRTDRGGGTVTVDKGVYTTTGTGSPSIYSTADITVSNAKLISKKSEGIVIEGKNSVSINNCVLTDNNTKLNGQSTTYKNIFLYQSMSGDADSGNAEFIAKNSTITTNKGDSFYITNTTATINLENNEIINNDSDGNFLRAQKDSWGNSGSNGGAVTLALTNQKVVGNIVIDSISTLDMTMKSSSYYEGIINRNNEAKLISLTIDKNSKIKLTGNSYITSLDNGDSSNSNIDFNGYKLYVNGKAIN